jgi:uncharacterized protein
MLKLLIHIVLLFNVLGICNVQAEDLALITAARKQVGVTKYYDASYTKLAYPNGDVALSKGVCTDVIIRAFRDAHQLDLQAEVHQDMRKNFALYPKKWGLKRPDKNIDHRRVPNLQVYFKRHWQSLKSSQDIADYAVGDVVTVMLPGNLPHIMLVSDAKKHVVIHNIGRGTREEASLFSYPITGHYRYLAHVN